MRKDVELDEMILKREGIQVQLAGCNVLSKQLAEYQEVVKVQPEEFKDLKEGTLDFNMKRDVWYSVWNWTVKVMEWMTTDFTYLGSSSSSAGHGVCVTANPALASHRVDCKMRSSPSEPASGSWVSVWQLAETAVAAWQEALTTAAAAAAVAAAAAAAAAAVAAAAVASCVGRDRQTSTSQPCRALKALASKLRLSTGARFSGSWVMASVAMFFPSPVFGGK